MRETNGIEIEKETFLGMNDDSKDAVLFDYLHYLKKKVDKIDRDTQNDRKKQYAVAGIAGVVGGFLAMVGKFFVDIFHVP